MSTPLLEVRNVVKKFGGFVAVDNVDFTVAKGERLGVIGPNGSGKSTTLGCIAGGLRQTSGEILLEGRSLNGMAPHERARVGIARSWQIPQPFGSMTLIENLAVPLEYVRHRGEFHRAGEVAEEAQKLLDDFGLGAKANTVASQLSQVELRKLELARAMASKPKLLLSDEAMAGLSSSEVDEVLDLLLQLSANGITIIMIEHIMRAVMRFSQRVICLDAGRIIAEDTPQDIVKSPLVRQAYLGA